MDCKPVEAHERPALPGEAPIDWANVETIEQAQDAHGRTIATIRTREGIVANYVLDLEARLFECASDDAWIEDYLEGAAAE